MATFDVLPVEILINHLWPNLTTFDLARRVQFVSKLWNKHCFESVTKISGFRFMDHPGACIRNDITPTSRD